MFQKCLVDVPNLISVISIIFAYRTPLLTLRFAKPAS